MVLTYLQDILAEKMPLLTKEGITQTQADTLTTPCVVRCSKSVNRRFCRLWNCGSTKMAIADRTSVSQYVHLPDGRKYYRINDGDDWLCDWKLRTEP